MKDKPLMIPAEQLTAYERWELPALEERAAAGRRPPRAAAREQRMQLPTAQELEALRKSAWDEGFQQGRQEGKTEGDARGYEEGWQRAREEITAQATRLANVINAFTQPLQQQESVLEQDLLLMVRAMAEAVIAHHVQIDVEPLRQQIVALIGQMAQRAEQLTVQMNPDDVALLRSQLQAHELWQSHWRIQENPLISQGGCIVESPQQYVDARLEVRQEMIAALLEAKPDEPA